MKPRALRVHVLIDSLSWGGAETLLGDFANGATAAGIEVSVAYLRDDTHSQSRFREAGVEPVCVPVRSLLNSRDRRAVREHIFSVGPDIVHTHLAVSDLVGGLAARKLGIPAVSTLHVMEWGNSHRDRIKARWTASTRRRCDARVIAVSEAARRSYLDTGWDRAERVITVRNGIVDAAMPGAGRQVREDLGLAPDDLVIVMLSHLRPGKGHEIAAAAIAKLRGRHPTLRLLVLGEGPARAEVERLMAPLGERALMTGPRDDVFAVLDAADVVIHPSRVDAFPTALLEAMASRVPAVATDVGGIPEIINDGETGVLIGAPPTVDGLAAALTTLLCDPALRGHLADAARARFEAEFTTDHWLERLTRAYETILSER